MKTLLIVLLLAAPASAAWDLNNLTPSQRSSLITMRNRWNNGYRGRAPCKRCTGMRSTYWIHPNVGAPASTSIYQPAYSGGPLTIINPYVTQ